MLKILINTTNGDIFIKDVGYNLLANSSYTIEFCDFLLWTKSRDTVTFIVSGDIIVNDGEDNLPIRPAIGLIQDNQVVLNEYYTLTCDDSVLVGEGKILYYNDEFSTTNNVPGYIDEPTEDDDPTNSIGSY